MLKMIFTFVSAPLAIAPVAVPVVQAPPLDFFGYPAPAHAPPSNFDCSVTNASWRRYAIKLRAAWNEKMKAYRVEVMSDQTGVLPKGQFLEKDVRAGTYKRGQPDWGWSEVGWIKAGNHGRTIYQLFISRDGTRGPRILTGERASISLVHATPGSTVWLDQFVGFCSVSPPNTAPPGYEPMFK